MTSSQGAFITSANETAANCRYTYNKGKTYCRNSHFRSCCGSREHWIIWAWRGQLQHCWTVAALWTLHQETFCATCILYL